MNRPARRTHCKAIHVHRNPVTGLFELQQRANGAAGAQQRTDRDSERDWAEDAMYAVYDEFLIKPTTVEFDTDLNGRPIEYRTSDSAESAPIGRTKMERPQGGGLQPSASTIRPRSEALPLRHASSICVAYTPPLYHKMFCAHDRFRGEPCLKCQRGTREAREWITSL
jgi:hypothetical protein